MEDKKLAVAREIFQIIAPKFDTDVSDILGGVSLVLATICAESQMTEEKAVYHFTKDFRQAQQRVKRVMKHEEL